MDWSWIQKQEMQNTRNAKGSKRKVPQVKNATDANYRKEIRQDRRCNLLDDLTDISLCICCRPWRTE